MSNPVTKAARHARISELVRSTPIPSQTVLARLLADEGMAVTQATLSRDLEELGAVKLRGADGSPASYVLPEEGAAPMRPSVAPPDLLVRRLQELLTGAEASGNLVVLRTPPGAAQFLASGLDRSGLPDIIGTIAGDDTILVITRDPAGGQAFAAKALDWAHRGTTPGPAGAPGHPSTPGDPGAPGRPSTPGDPGAPGRPSTPGDPGTPGRPSTPGDPGTPGRPSTPGDPGTPGHPSTPGDADTPTHTRPAAPDLVSSPDSTFSKEPS